MEVEIISVPSKKTLTNVSKLNPNSTILDVKKAVQRNVPHLYLDRQSLRLDAKGKSLNDGDKLNTLNVPSGGQLFLKDLGPQIGWKTVFLIEYSGPLFVYLLFYIRPSIIYGKGANLPVADVVHLAAACWVGHYLKRILETLFVHRFSHATMPVRNLFKNCSYYWGFAAYIAYYVNHPLYTEPMFGKCQIIAGLAGFLLCELGNLSIHVALKNLRPPGSKDRRIPQATWNPFTLLFHFVSCPNYTYEIGSWLSFTVLTQCLPAGFFTVAGFYQMAVWALQKHHNYKKEFSKYPRGRKAIVPFIL